MTSQSQLIRCKSYRTVSRHQTFSIGENHSEVMGMYFEISLLQKMCTLKPYTNNFYRCHASKNP
uniref:Uncharacterized protein n=2 Tax=Anguilla anguilla TaxID=7936 RepID=A0A0E9TED4_ANGAN